MIQPKTFLLIILKVNAALFCRRTHIMNSLINQKKGKKKTPWLKIQEKTDHEWRVEIRKWGKSIYSPTLTWTNERPKKLFKTKTKSFLCFRRQTRTWTKFEGHQKLYISEKKKLAIYGEKDSKSISHLTLPKAQVSPITRFSDWNSLPNSIKSTLNFGAFTIKHNQIKPPI